MSPVAVSLSVLKGAVKENSAARGPSPQPAGSVVDGRAEKCTLQPWQGRRRAGSEHTGHGWCGAGGVRAQSCCHQALRAVLLLPLGPVCHHLCSCRGWKPWERSRSLQTAAPLSLPPGTPGLRDGRRARSRRCRRDPAAPLPSRGAAASPSLPQPGQPAPLAGHGDGEQGCYLFMGLLKARL